MTQYMCTLLERIVCATVSLCEQRHQCNRLSIHLGEREICNLVQDREASKRRNRCPEEQ